MSQTRRKWLIWPTAVLGRLVAASGLAGIVGASLNASTGFEQSNWYVLQQIAQSAGTALLGVAVALCAAWSAREYRATARYCGD
jgi:hypothetical protein